uniref:Uncharacterized protein n=1 Tax=Neisseria meningitidis alpha153 TaxID=663926 RepID=C6SE43_NEIME|nr:hypothetical protein predicted by Glimmer/Critica [Neisseria meningitidis alpha153]
MSLSYSFIWQPKVRDKYFFHGLCLSQAAVIAGLIVVGMKKFQTA